MNFKHLKLGMFLRLDLPPDRDYDECFPFGKVFEVKPCYNGSLGISASCGRVHPVHWPETEELEMFFHVVSEETREVDTSDNEDWI